MVSKYLTDEELREIMENSDDFEISDEGESDSGDNEEKQIEVPDEIEIEVISDIEDY